jgi:hypothetical protein
MANRFWVAGGNGVWTSTTNWSTTTGGSSGASSPGSADTAIFDGSSGGGTITIDATLSGLTIAGLTTSAFTGTLDFSTNNPSFTIGASSWTDANTGTHTINMGSGTWTFNSSGAPNITAGANLTLNANTSTISFAPSTTQTVARTFALGGKTFATVSISGTNQGGTGVTINGGSGTIGTLNVSNGAIVGFQGGGTVTITNAFNPTGTLAAPLFFQQVSGGSTSIIIASGGASLTYVGLAKISFAGSTGAVNGTNSWDFGGNNYNGGSNSTPSGGGGSSSHMIGG